jgi:hypothetical protein
MNTIMMMLSQDDVVLSRVKLDEPHCLAAFCLPCIAMMQNLAVHYKLWRDFAMRTIETTATITPDGTLTAHIPTDIGPGERAVVIVISEPDETPVKATQRPLVELHAFPWTNWPAGSTFRREDLYGDDGR